MPYTLLVRYDAVIYPGTFLLVLNSDGSSMCVSWTVITLMLFSIPNRPKYSDFSEEEPSTLM